MEQPTEPTLTEVLESYGKPKEPMTFKSTRLNKSLKSYGNLATDEMYKKLREEVDAIVALERTPLPCSDHSIDLKYPAEFNLRESIELSDRLTTYAKIPVYVLPSGDKPSKGFEVGNYCEFNFKVTTSMSQAKKRFEIAATYKNYKKDYKSSMSEEDFPVVTEYKTCWCPGSFDMRSWIKLKDATFNMDVYTYLCALEDNREFILLTEQELRPGENYKTRALVWVVPRLDTKVKIGEKIVLALPTYIEPEKQELPSHELLTKCKEQPMEWFVKSVMYPFDNCSYLYAQAVTLELFRIKNLFPFNMWIVGEPGTGKSAVLDKLSIICNDKVWDSGRSTIKGLLPSFAPNFSSAGMLVTAKRRGLVNEFNDIIGTSDPRYRAQMLDQLKGLLEGNDINYTSGFGQMQVRMSADMIAASNVPTKSGGSCFGSVVEMYGSYLSNALLDRFLFIWLGEEQAEYVNFHREEVKTLISSTNRKNQKDALKMLDYGDLLKPNEIRSLMNLLNVCKYKIDNKVTHGKWYKNVLGNVPHGILSRAYEFYFNIASAYCALRTLSEGALIGSKVAPEDTEFVIKECDEQLASSLLVRLIEEYAKYQPGIMNRRRAMNSLTSTQLKVYSYIEDKFYGNDNKFSRRVPVSELLSVCGKETDLNSVLSRLASVRLIVFDSAFALLFDESPDATSVFDSVARGTVYFESEVLPLHLVKRGLIVKREDGKYAPLWSNDYKSVLPAAQAIDNFAKQ
jgi:hypothetical protein